MWKDGNFVEGSGVKRRKVTYSNWTSAHASPDDLRKHRELLDRQHFSGPLWEGIEKKKIWEDQDNIVIDPKDLADNLQYKEENEKWFKENPDESERKVVTLDH